MPVTAAEFDKASEELESGLWNVIAHMRSDRDEGKSSADVVLVAGQRLQVLMLTVERTLKGIEWPDE